MIDVKAKNIVAKRIKIARVENDLTQAQLAELLNVNQQNIVKWESGQTSMGIDTLERIAFALGKPIEWFFQPFEVAVERKKAAARR